MRAVIISANTNDAIALCERLAKGISAQEGQKEQKSTLNIIGMATLTFSDAGGIKHTISLVPSQINRNHLNPSYSKNSDTLVLVAANQKDLKDVIDMISELKTKNVILIMDKNLKLSAEQAIQLKTKNGAVSVSVLDINKNDTDITKDLITLAGKSKPAEIKEQSIFKDGKNVKQPKPSEKNEGIKFEKK